MANEVLALHQAIREVTVVENRAGELQVTERATKDSDFSLEAVNEREKEIIAAAPTMVLGAASQVGNLEKAGRLRLVGLLYEERGSLCVPINEESYLMVTTETEGFLEVMKTLQDSLLRLMQKRNVVSEPRGVTSAIEADQAIRSFFAATKLSEPTSVRLENATFDATKQFWQISGTYRPPHAVRTKRYHIELDARTGAITKFQGQA